VEKITAAGENLRVDTAKKFHFNKKTPKKKTPGASVFLCRLTKQP
jgi:hypothetical protein